MINIKTLCFVASLNWVVLPCFAAHEIAITIDDLPFVGANNNNGSNMKRVHERFGKIMQSLIENNVPATGFVIANSIVAGEWQLLENFRNAGFGIGNHTYSHANLNRMTPEKYKDDVARADKILAPIMTEPKYFRYPYLAEGKGTNKEDVQEFLAANGYVIAPVTIDSKDYMFNERLLRIPFRQRPQHLNQIKKQYLDYIWQQTLRVEKKSGDDSKQILLLHANLLNSHFLGDIIQMYKEHGYRFITLTEALSGANQAKPAQPIGESAFNQTILEQDWLWSLDKEW